MSPTPKKAHTWQLAEHEHYVDEPWVSAALFREESFEGAIHDPCCGFGNIVHSARDAGFIAYGTDIEDRGFEGTVVHDFLACTDSIANLVFNPPFGSGEAFARHAVKFACRKVAILYPTRRLNAAGRWLQELPLTRIWYITPRPSMPPGDVYRELEAKGKRPSGGTQDFAWLVFDAAAKKEPLRFNDWSAPATVGWLHKNGK